MSKPKFKVGDKVMIVDEHSFITELPDNQKFKIVDVVKDNNDIFYHIETPLGVKFSVNNFEIYKI